MIDCLIDRLYQLTTAIEEVYQQIGIDCKYKRLKILFLFSLMPIMNHNEHRFYILSRCLAGRPCVDCHAFEFMQRALQDLKKTAFNLDARVTVAIPFFLVPLYVTACHFIRIPISCCVSSSYSSWGPHKT